MSVNKFSLTLKQHLPLSSPLPQSQGKFFFRIISTSGFCRRVWYTSSWNGVRGQNTTSSSGKTGQTCETPGTQLTNPSRKQPPNLMLKISDFLKKSRILLSPPPVESNEWLVITFNINNSVTHKDKQKHQGQTPLYFICACLKHFISTRMAKWLFLTKNTKLAHRTCV